MRLYGALPGGVNGLGAMSVSQLAAALDEPAMKIHLAAGFNSEGSNVGNPNIATAMKIHLADTDPRHLDHRQDGVHDHNMKLCLASWPPEKQKEQTLGQTSAQRETPDLKLRILLSFHYYKDTDLDALFAKYFTRPYPDVFVDSGGFSAMTQGAEIDLDAYCTYIRRFAPLIQVYANLDVIGNAEATLANQKRMEDKGLRPLPVFHVGEPWEYLERYIEAYPYIALGGMVPHMRFPKRIMPWLVRCFKMAQSKSVYHGFGATSWTIVSALPWYSVDSSSWGMGFRFGNVPLFDEQRGRFVDARLGDTAGCYKLASLFRSLGFDPADFADRSRNDRAKICAISALSYMKAEQWLRKRHGEVHIPGRDGAPIGLRTHLADANPARFGEAVSGVNTGPRLHLSDTSNGVNLGDAEAGLKAYLVDTAS